MARFHQRLLREWLRETHRRDRTLRSASAPLPRRQVCTSIGLSLRGLAPSAVPRRTDISGRACRCARRRSAAAPRWPLAAPRCSRRAPGTAHAEPHARGLAACARACGPRPDLGADRAAERRSCCRSRSVIDAGRARRRPAAGRDRSRPGSRPRRPAATCARGVCPDGIELTLPLPQARARGVPRRGCSAGSRCVGPIPRRAGRGTGAAGPTPGARPTRAIRARAADRLGARRRSSASERAPACSRSAAAQDDARAGAHRWREFLARHFGPGARAARGRRRIDDDALADGGRRRVRARAGEHGHARPTARVRVDRRTAWSSRSPTQTPSAWRSRRPRLRRPRTPRRRASRRGSSATARRSACARASRGHVFAVARRALALLRVRRARGGRGRTRRRARARAAAPRRTAARPRPHDRRAAIRRALARGSARAGSRTARRHARRRLALGVGVLVAGGRADKLAQPDPDAALRERRSEQLAGRVRGRQRAARGPSCTATSTRTRAAVTLDNGARLELRARAATRWRSPCASRAARRSSRRCCTAARALLATLTATACAGLSPEQLSGAPARARRRAAAARGRRSRSGVALTAPAAQLAGRRSRWRSTARCSRGSRAGT